LAEKKLSPAEFQKKQAYREPGVEYPTINPENRLSFELVHPSLDDSSAMKEAERCLYCNDICNTCVGVCPNFANLSFQSEVFEMPIYQARRNNGSIEIDTVDKLSIKQKNQILNIGDFCNECGNCTTFCPTSGDPYKIKPRFHLTEESFNTEETGYFLTSKTIKYKDKKEISSLSETKDKFVFENNILTAYFDKKNLSVSDINFKDASVKNADLRKAAEMIYLLKSLNNFTIFA
jgi:putative selenate reductase